MDLDQRGGKYSPGKGCMTDCYLLIAIDDLLCEFAVAGHELHNIQTGAIIGIEGNCRSVHALYRIQVLFLNHTSTVIINMELGDFTDVVAEADYQFFSYRVGKYLKASFETGVAVEGKCPGIFCFRVGIPHFQAVKDFIGRNVFGERVYFVS